MFDFLIVGAGSAGCLLANRLSQNPKNSVLLLEAGPANRNPLFRVPLLGPALGVGSKRLDWGYQTLPDKGRQGLVQDWPRGRMLGGSSRLNGMVYVRGASGDFDHWEKLGCKGWGWSDVEPIFRRFERIDEPDKVHGCGGDFPIHRLRHPHPLSRAFIEAHRSLDLGGNLPYNSGHQEGASILVSSNDGHWRSDGSSCHLRVALNRQNLGVLTGAKVSRLIFEGRRCVAVQYSQDGEAREVAARRDVFLSAGALETPALLMRSGIGPESELRAHGIDVRLDQPGVGKNLHEHPAVQIVARSKTQTISTQDKPWHLPRHVFNWWVRRGGLLSAASYEAVSFLRSDPAQERPDIQLHFSPYGLARKANGLRPVDVDSFMIQANLSHPKSRGEVRLKDAKPDSAPLIDHQMFREPDDLGRLCLATKLALQLFNDSAFADHFAGFYLPEDLTATTADFEDIIRRSAVPAYHPAGTCRMGSDNQAVVGPDLRVKGLAGLKIADASIIPSPISGNIQATVLMIAEKAALQC